MAHRTAALILTLAPLALAPGAAPAAEGTRAQHVDWMRKHETPGGTLAAPAGAAEDDVAVDLRRSTWCAVIHKGCGPDAGEEET